MAVEKGEFWFNDVVFRACPKIRNHQNSRFLLEKLLQKQPADNMESEEVRRRIHMIESNRVYVVLSVKARLKSAIVDIQWLLFGLYVNRVQSTPAAQSEQ